MSTLHILRVPSKEIARKPIGERWCFGCRKRLPHDQVIRAPIDPMSWYGPGPPKWECSRCGEDNTDFPGTFKEWNDELTAASPLARDGG